MAGGRFTSLAIVGLLLVTGGASGLKTLKTQDLFDEAYRPQDSRKFKVDGSETFSPEPSKTFDLSYADGTELQGFTGNDIVHVRDRPLTCRPRSSPWSTFSPTSLFLRGPFPFACLSASTPEWRATKGAENWQRGITKP